ncbi:MAG: hypothetical protein M3262_02940 [Actinomycetota bacterium]|nr:hypothetical protein [Actinomycetota bacterium]
MYWRRRILAVSVVLLSILALVLAASARTPGGATDRALPIDPENAGPDVVLAEVAGIYISSPIRPEDLTGLGYHPEGESLIEMSPRGRNLSGNPLLRLFASDSTPEKIQYYLMDSGDRRGPPTGALDVGAEAGTPVYAPVTGTVTAIRPDPLLREGVNIVEIKPADDRNVRILVSLVQELGSEVGPKSPVTAGITELGSVADSAKVLRPQLAHHTADAGNHVTVTVFRTDD